MNLVNKEVKIMQNKRAFTLIELLIVVAIIAILAAIAVPNFLEAQVRSKVSRAKSDMRSLTTGMEAYFVDWNRYPRSNWFHLAYPVEPSASGNQGFVLLTTPIAYLTSLFLDPFVPQRQYTGSGTYIDIPAEEVEIMKYYGYSGRDDLGSVGTVGTPDNDTNSPGGVKWYILQSSGPDRVRCTLGSSVLTYGTPDAFSIRIYDATNGTVSFGSVYRVGGSPIGPGTFAFTQIQQAQ